MEENRSYMLSLKYQLIIVTVIISSLLIYSNPWVNAANQIDRQLSVLTGDQQIPPVKTDARGYVGLKFQDDLTRFVFTVDKVVDKTQEVKTKGTVSIGGAISDDLQGQLKGKSLSDLHESMVNGSVYVIIHTKDFPNGEIRGNSFVGIDRIFPDITDIKWK